MSEELKYRDPSWLVIAKEKIKAPAGWQWCRLEAVDKSARPNARHDVIVEGGIPKTLARGPRKGKPSWTGVPRDRCVITEEEMDAEAKRYEAQTGLCSSCSGNKRTISGFGQGGTTYRDCTKCGATGVAPT